MCSLWYSKEDRTYQDSYAVGQLWPCGLFHRSCWACRKRVPWAVLQHQESWVRGIWTAKPLVDIVSAAGSLERVEHGKRIQHMQVTLISLQDFVRNSNPILWKSLICRTTRRQMRSQESYGSSFIIQKESHSLPRGHNFTSGKFLTCDHPSGLIGFHVRWCQQLAGFGGYFFVCSTWYAWASLSFSIMEVGDIGMSSSWMWSSIRFCCSSRIFAPSKTKKKKIPLRLMIIPTTTSRGCLRKASSSKERLDVSGNKKKTKTTSNSSQIQ